MANFEAFRWNISSSTNSEIGRSDYIQYFDFWFHEFFSAPKNTNNPIIPKQQQHLELFSKFVQMSSTVRLQGLDNLQDIIQIFILNQNMKTIDDEEKHFQNMQDHIWNYWKIIAECYLNYVNMFDNVNQLFSKVMIKLGM